MDSDVGAVVSELNALSITAPVITAHPIYPEYRFDIPPVAQMILAKHEPGNEAVRNRYSNEVLSFRLFSGPLDIRIPLHRSRDTSAYGLLYRGADFPVIVTASGYTTPDHSPIQGQPTPATKPGMQSGLPHQLNKVLWAEAAVKMCSVLDFEIPETAKGHRDHEIFPRQYWACHVEAQFLAFVFAKHTALAFTPELRRLAAKLGVFEDLGKDSVVIHVNYPVCSSCRRVIAGFTEKTGIKVSVYADWKREIFEGPEGKAPQPLPYPLEFAD